MKKFFSIILGILSLWACDISKNKEIKPEEVFVKIYENNNFDQNFTPLDIKQTTDGGYLILGEYASNGFSPFPAVYLMKVQPDGKFEWEYLARENYVTPISELLPSTDGNFEFFCSAQNDSLKPVRLSATQNPQELAKYNLIRGLVANALPDGNYGFVSYPQNSQNTIVSTGSPNGNILRSKQYYNQDNTFIEERIDRHLRRVRTPLPMLMSSRGGNDLFFTAFRLSNIAVMSDDLASAGSEPKGIINGNSYDAAISAMVQISGNTFAMARYNADGETVFIPRAEVALNGIYTNTSFRGNVLPEISKFARVVIRRATIAQRNVLLYLTDTKNGQIVLFVYDEATGNLIRTQYFGSANTFQIGSLTLTTDGGIAIVGKTFVAGRFGRICLFKLSPQEVEKWVK
ncbi:hypothetical protein [Raineya sp.]|jgi:hypothetical protein